MTYPREILLSVSLALCMIRTPAWAVLGGSPGGVEVEGQPLSAASSVIPATEYAVHELTTPEMMVREYVSLQGEVFAVTWSGRRSPDLPKLFGAYFEQYVAASADRDKRRSPLRGFAHVETADLIVETGGHMGALWGKAYLPSRLPPGIAKEAIQ